MALRIISNAGLIPGFISISGKSIFDWVSKKSISLKSLNVLMFIVSESYPIKDATKFRFLFWSLSSYTPVSYTHLLGLKGRIN